MVRGSVRAALAVAVMFGLLVPVGRLHAAAQDQSQDKAQSAPESAMPPAGMCRVWLRDVPERQQPAPTDCSTAIRTMPRDATVLFGDLKRAAKVSPNAEGSLNQAQRNAPARDVPPAYRGAGNVAGDARAAQQQRGNGASGVTGVSATAPGGSAAATKAPETKAAIKPEKPQ